MKIRLDHRELDLPPCPFICPNEPRFGYDTKQLCDGRSGCSVPCVLSCE